MITQFSENSFEYIKYNQKMSIIDIAFIKQIIIIFFFFSFNQNICLLQTYWTFKIYIQILQHKSLKIT